MGDPPARNSRRRKLPAGVNTGATGFSSSTIPPNAGAQRYCLAPATARFSRSQIFGPARQDIAASSNPTAAPHFIAFPSNGNLISSSPRSVAAQRRDLVKRRVANLTSTNLRRALHHLAQGFQHFRIAVATVTVRILFFVPQTDRHRFGAPRNDKCKLVLEAFLLAKQRKCMFFDEAGGLPQNNLLLAGGKTPSQQVQTSPVLIGRQEERPNPRPTS